MTGFSGSKVSCVCEREGAGVGRGREREEERHLGSEFSWPTMGKTKVLIFGLFHFLIRGSGKIPHVKLCNGESAGPEPGDLIAILVVLLFLCLALASPFISWFRSVRY